MSKMLRFGGPKLPAGTHTFYVVSDERGDLEYRAEVGHEVAFDKVTNAQHYIDSGLATLATGKGAVAKETA